MSLEENSQNELEKLSNLVKIALASNSLELLQLILDNAISNPEKQIEL